jgi:hypothetical protein
MYILEVSSQETLLTCSKLTKSRIRFVTLLLLPMMIYMIFARLERFEIQILLQNSNGFISPVKTCRMI